jgi:predicted ribosome quality control (RQC) complex YloA/Tae2 family protein
MARIELYLDKSIEQNAGIYFEKAKKYKKKIEGAKQAIAVAEKKLRELEKKKTEEKEEYDAKQVKSSVKREWYEKFRWFITSSGFLVLGGRDATTNEIIIKKHTGKNDVVFHTDLAGSPFFVIKTEGKNVPDIDLRQAADATVTFSRVFKIGTLSSPVFYCSPEQITKEAKAGEYLTKGAFVIRGKVNYIENRINIAVGKLEDGRLMAAPLESVKVHCKEYIILERGNSKPSEIAKLIKAKLGGDVTDIIRILPSGEMGVKK